MPTASHSRDDDDDPVILSYDVFVTPHLNSAETNSRLFVLQYPAHRPPSKPYNLARSQKPTSLRLKPNTGVLELDVPLFTTQNYNVQKGEEFGHAMAETKAAHAASGYGLSNGFGNVQQTATPRVGLEDIPDHNEEQLLQQQTLAGKVIESNDREPIYMLASMRSDMKSIHLSHLDGVIQMRPQLHHLDALDELNARKSQGNSSSAGKGTTKVGVDLGGGATAANPGPARIETKAIEMKLKDATVAGANDPNRDRNLNANARILRDIQADTWRSHAFIDESDESSIAVRDTALYHELSTRQTNLPITSETPTTHRLDLRGVPKLRSRLDNDEWLDKMSSPGIELRTRLKGRDRERARRKRQERLRNAKPVEGGEGVATGTETKMANAAGPSTGPFIEEGTATEEEDDESSESEAEAEIEMGADVTTGSIPKTGIPATPVPLLESKPVNEPEIKVESDSTSAANTARASNTTTTPKKRGRPKKSTASEVIDVD